MKGNKKVSLIFDKAASLYLKNSNDYTLNRRFSAASHHISGRVLDVGGASGLFISAITENENSYMLDISFNMCREAKNNFKVKSVCADSEMMPFNNNSFDSIVSLEMIYYLDSPRNFISECDRVLVDNGTLVLSFFNPNLHFLTVIRRMLRRLGIKNMFFDDGDPRSISIEVLRDYIDDTNLQISSVNRIILIPFKKFDRINKILESSILSRLTLFNIVVLNKINKNV